AWPGPSVTVSVTGVVPPALYVRLGATTFPAEVPSPKVHARETMPWSSLDASLVKEQVDTTHVNPRRATGGRSGGGVVVTLVVAVELWPAPSNTVSVTTCVPARAYVCSRLHSCAAGDPSPKSQEYAVTS